MTLKIKVEKHIYKYNYTPLSMSSLTNIYHFPYTIQSCTFNV